MDGLEAYSAFLPLNGKASMIKFKDVPDSKRLTFDQAEAMKGANGVGGILKSEFVVVDIDDPYQFDRALQMIRENDMDVLVRKTSRGGHIIARNNGSGAFDACGTDRQLAMGFKADIKTGKACCYEAIKVDGQLREIVYQPSSGELGAMPKAFEPVKSDSNFLAMGEGDGRNSALFTHILALTGAGFTKDDARQTLRWMNKYVLREPLPDDELETIMRDGAFPKGLFGKGRGFRHDLLGQTVIMALNVCLIDGHIHSYRDGFYVAGTKPLETYMVEHDSTLKDSQIRETLSYIGRVTKSVEHANAKFIGFANGILNIETGELGTFTPEIVITNRIPWNYDPKAYSETADRALDDWVCNDREIRALLEEMVGYCLFRDNRFQKMFVLTGDRANGKSTFLNFLTFALGRENCTALDLAGVGARFGTASLAGKMANIGDDIADDFLNGAEVAMIKKIVTGERLSGEFKGQDVFEFSPFAKMIFSANEIPRMKDRTGAMLRRLMIIPFRASFNGSAGRTDLRQQLRTREAAEYLLRLGVEGLRRVLANSRFTEPSKVRDELDAFELSNDPIWAFLDERDVPALLLKPADDIYRDYQQYAYESGLNPASKGVFNKEICARLGVKTQPRKIAGKSHRMFVVTK